MLRTGLQFRAAICCGLALIAAGCSASGGAITIFPNDHELLESTRCAAKAANRHEYLPRELQKSPLEIYYVQPGDVLLIENNDLNSDVRLAADQTVMPDGTIDLGNYGRPVVAGMTVEAIEKIIIDSVKATEPNAHVEQINVRLTVAESSVYYVLGEVNAPGSYPLIGRETVLDGILAAGGLSDRASNCEIILSRPSPDSSCAIVLPVCYDHIVQLGSTTTNYQLRPGDRIYVTTRSCCDQLMFWKKKCELCPDCGVCRCATSQSTPGSPYVSASWEHGSAPNLVVPDEPTEEMPAPTPKSESPPFPTAPPSTSGKTTAPHRVK